MSNPTLCLNMIVKNESKNILRVLNSVLPIIDSYCICDTGSTDDTIKMINNFFKDKPHIKGKIVVEKFINFSHNRNLAKDLAKDMSDYLLLIDADMELCINNFKKSDLLQADVFQLYQIHNNNALKYPNVRIIKNSSLCKYVGATHEYIESSPNARMHIFNTDSIYMKDHDCGGSKHDKYSRDIILLKKEIENNSNVVRSTFYLAQTYYYKGDSVQSIYYYKKRLEQGGWQQELYMSAYRIGEGYKKLGKHTEMIYYFNKAFEICPKRVESIYELVNYYRNTREYNLARLYYEKGVEILEKQDKVNDFLFQELHIYTSKFYFEGTIIYAYLGITDIFKNSYLSKSFVNTLNNPDNSIVNTGLSNLKFYNNILEQESVIDFTNSFNVFDKQSNNIIKLNSSTPCIIKGLDNGYLMNIRYINYTINNNGKYIGCDDNVINYNKLVYLDNKLNVIKSELYEPVYDYSKYIVGIEDIRIFYNNNNKLEFTGTVCNENKKITIGYGNYERADDNSLQYICPNPNFNEQQWEKNWVFGSDEEFVYKWYPLTITEINKETNELCKIKEKVMPNLFKECRGSTGFCEYDDELWSICHIVSNVNGERWYYNVLTVFDKEYNLKRYSAPFKLEKHRIEFCLGLVVEKERILISYSSNDGSSKIGIYNKEYIDNILEFK